MKKFNFEKWLAEHTNFEDPDSDLRICTTENGGVCISDIDGSTEVLGTTLGEACRNFDMAICKIDVN